MESISDPPEDPEPPAVFGRHGRKIKVPKWKEDYYYPTAPTKRAHNSDQEKIIPAKKCEMMSFEKFGCENLICNLFVCSLILDKLNITETVIWIAGVMLFS